ncbi:MAG: MBL fold metallo-hydrolase, partial [Oscillospiraceae bacterium]|nr:MBL fold metallo-hydrolase [Oscillospiraceae bacterium]
MITYETIAVGMLQSNSYVLRDGSTGVLALVDCGAWNKSVRDAIARQGGNLCLILLTHGHFDHIQGAKAAREANPGAQIAISHGDAPYLRGEIDTLPGRVSIHKSPAVPDLLLGDGDTIALGGSVLQVIASPGHTAGGVCFWSEPDRLLFTGDTLFREDVGRDDLPGGSWPALEQSIRRLYALPGDYKVLPGHGPESSLEHERAHNQHVRN